MKIYAFVLSFIAFSVYADVFRPFTRLKFHSHELKADPHLPSIIIGFDFDDVLMPTSLLRLSEIPIRTRDKISFPQSNLLDLVFKSNIGYEALTPLLSEIPWLLPLNIQNYLEIKDFFDENGYVLFRRGTQIRKIISQLSIAASFVLLDASELATDKIFILSNGTPAWIEGAAHILGEPFLGVFSRLRQSGKLEVHSSYSFQQKAQLGDFSKRWNFISRLFIYDLNAWRNLWEESFFKAHAMSHVLSALNNQLSEKGYTNPWNLVYVGDLPHDMVATYAQSHPSLKRSAGIKVFGDQELRSVYSDKNRLGLSTEALNFFWYQKIQELTVLRGALFDVVKDMNFPNKEQDLSRFSIYRLSNFSRKERRIKIFDRPSRHTHPEELVGPSSQ